MKTTSAQASSCALQWLIDYVHANRGAIQKLTEVLSARTGKTIYYQNVSQWLNLDPKQRVEPKLGIGLLLMDEGAKLLAGADPLRLDVQQIGAKPLNPIVYMNRLLSAGGTDVPASVKKRNSRKRTASRK